MGRLIDCQMAFVTWGVRARFRQGKVGLLRKGTTVYLTFVFANEYHKFPILKDSISILPAAIRIKTVRKDLFIRDAIEETRYENMIRSIKVILRQEELRRNGKGAKLDKLIAEIPKFDAINLKQQVPQRLSTTLVGRNFTGLDNGQHTTTDGAQIGLNIDGDNDVQMIFNDDARELKRRLDTYQQLRCIKTIGIRDLPDNLCLADSLNRLALIECNLVHVPKQLETLSRSLLYLDLSRNNINKLPRSFCCKMNKLRYLNLSHNLIETLPLEIKFFSRLVDLDISNNHLRLLPSTFSDLRRLKTLNVANNNLSQLPAFRKEDIRLELLDISCNPLDGALDSISTFEVFPSYDDGSLGYQEMAFSHPFSTTTSNITPKQQNRVPKLFEISMLNIVRCDFLFKLASEESLPDTIVSTMQRDIFKCYRCNEMNMLPAYNSTDFLDYVEQVNQLITTQNYRNGMTFMKLLCRECFGRMSL